MDDFTNRRLKLEKHIPDEPSEGPVAMTGDASGERGGQIPRENGVSQGIVRPIARFLLGFTVVFALAIAVWPQLPRHYESRAVIVLRPTDVEANDQAQAMRQPLDESAIQSEIDAISSTRIADTIIAVHGLANDPEFTESRLPRPQLVWPEEGWLPAVHFGGDRGPISQSALRQNLRERMLVERDRRSYTLAIGFRSTDPVKAEALTQTLLSTYLETQVERKQRAAESLYAWLTDRVDLGRSRLMQSEETYRAYLARTGLLDRGAQISLEAQLAALSTDLAATRSQAIEARTRSASLQAMQQNGAIDSAPEVLASPTIRSLRERMIGALSRTVVASPEFQAISGEIDAEVDRIVRSAASAAAALAEREELLQAEIMNIRRTLSERHEAELAAERLQIEAANDRTALEEALTRLKDVAGAVNFRPDAEVIMAPETPDRPASPSLFMALIGTFLAACLAGVLMNWRLILVGGRRLMA
jgi:polysaccharide biosynthesis transport protein